MTEQPARGNAHILIQMTQFDSVVISQQGIKNAHQQ